MIVNSRPNKIDYEIYFKGLTTQSTGYKIVAQMHNQVAYSAIIKKGVPVVKGSISTGKLINGILHLTLFDEKETPVAERLCFVDPLNIVLQSPVITYDTLNFSSKALNSWRIEQDTITWFSYSVQITDAALPEQNDFLSNYFLAGEVSQSVHNTEWYFDDITEKKADALDAILISEKAKNLSWHEVLNGKFPEITSSPEKNFLTYKATVIRSKKIQPEKLINLIFQMPDSSVYFLQAPTDSEGNFILTDLTFTDTAMIFYQQNKQKVFAGPVNVKLEPLNVFHPFKSELPNTPYTLVQRVGKEPVPENIARAIETKKSFEDVTNTYKILENVTVTSSAKRATEELDNKLASGMFRSSDAMIFDFVNENQSAMGHMDVIEWLQGRVPGLYIQNINGVPTPTMRGSVPALFVDEMQTDIDRIRGLPISDIAMVKVFRGIFFGASGGSTGAIAIYTLRGDTRQAFPARSLPSNIIAGYRKATVFFSPDHSKRLMENIRDKRDILFRRDLLTPDENSKAVIRFYNNEITKDFRIRVIGIANNAEPVYLEKIISAKKE